MGNPSITVWTRIEPSPRSGDVKASLRAEVRDPAWFLGRQWQLGEFNGEDAGSPAFVEVKASTADIVQFSAGALTTAYDRQLRPLEPPALAEPHTPDLATKVELSQVFFRLLDQLYGAAKTPVSVRGAFLQAVPLGPARGSPFDPLEGSTQQFMLVVGDQGIDGAGLLGLAQSNTVPPGITGQDATNVGLAYPKFVAWVKAVFGAVGTDPPPAWDPQHLDNHLTVGAGPTTAPTTFLATQPDADGRLEWSSFDWQSQTGDPFGPPPTTPLRVVPGHVRFPGMPANRYWDFEDGNLALPDIDLEKRDIQKLLVIDFALVHGVDWFVLPLELPVGTLARIDSLVVRDVFGIRTTINRADETGKPPGPSRWTMFSVSQPGAGLTNFTVVPPSAGPGLLAGPILEDVRFARDENANMAWAIERTTEGRIGQPRPGSERDAAVDAATPTPTATGTDPDAPPLAYRLESKVPLNWIPLVAVPIPLKAPAIQLQKARVLRPGEQITDPPRAVPPIGKVLKPEPYLLPEEEVPRSGLRVERAVFRSRWTDGSAHLWVARRRKGGAGETQSGLRFDGALPNPDRG
jgi:hypothetical protein